MLQHLFTSRRPYWPCLLLGGLLAGGCSSQQAVTPSPPDIEGAEERTVPDVPLPKVQFRDITRQAGIDFQHCNGSFGQKLLPETMGSGVLFFDYDNDGQPDLLLVNSCDWPGHEKKGPPRPTQALYRNRSNGTFEDVTKAAGLDLTFYGMGVTAGDYDNDGWTDIFLTGVGGNHLFHNEAGPNQQRRFVAVTDRSLDLRPRGGWPTTADILQWKSPIDWSSSAAFVDYDNDGRLDLFVCNYIDWSPTFDLAQGFTLAGHGRAYGPPRAFKGSHCQLFHNEGQGKFVDVSILAGIPVSGALGEPEGKALGVVVCDVDRDGWQDILVGNDTVRNFFFHNQGNGTFKEIGQQAGVAYAEGQARGAMGMDWGEYRPGRHALAIGNFANEPNTLLRLDQPQRLLFSDVALPEGMGGPSRIMLVFGLFFFDYDLDGRLDFLSCNGHLEPDIHTIQPNQSYKQPAQLFWNTGQRRTFEPMTATEAGPDLFAPQVGRGSAYADIDGDGDLDVVLTANGGAARLLRNEGGTGHHWIRFQLIGDGKRSNASAIGARVVLHAGGKTQERRVTSARGYLSQSELPLTFGLGTTDRVERVEIHWPGTGTTPHILENPAVDRVHVVRQKEPI